MPKCRGHTGVDPSSGRGTVISVHLVSLPSEEKAWARGTGGSWWTGPPPPADPARRGLLFRPHCCLKT